MEKIIVIYHKDCVDGTAAAAVVLRRFPEAKVFPLSHSFSSEDISPILELVTSGTEVYTVDCGLGVKELLDAGCKVTTLDHHISEKAKLEDLAEQNPLYTYVFDNEKSGASLSWSYFFPNEPQPELIKYIEDGDLWHWAYGDDTKDVYSYFSLYINQPEYFIPFLDEDLAVVKAEGKILSCSADFNIEKMTRDARPLKLRIDKYMVPAYNITMYESSVGNNLSTQTNQTAVLFTIKGDTVKFSFRSKESQEPTALDLAKILGGGGHKFAAGASIPLRDFLKMIL